MWALCTSTVSVYMTVNHHKKSISNSKIKKIQQHLLYDDGKFLMFSRSNSEYFCTFWTTSASPRHPNEHLQKPTQARSFYIFFSQKKSTVEQTPFPCLTFFFENNHNKTIDKCDDVYQKSNKAWNGSFFEDVKNCVCISISSKYQKNFVVCLDDWCKWDSYHYSIKICIQMPNNEFLTS